MVLNFFHLTSHDIQTATSDLSSDLICVFQLVVLSNRPLSIMPQRSSNELSFVKAAKKRKALSESNMKGSLMGSNSNLEDVQVRQVLPSFVRNFYIFSSLWSYQNPFSGGWWIWGGKEPKWDHNGSDQQWCREQWKWGENSNLQKDAPGQSVSIHTSTQIAIRHRLLIYP